MTEGKLWLLLVPSQVDDGVILYDQKMPGSVGLLAEDSFTFTISSPPAFLPLHTFTIVISYQTSKHRNSSHPRTRLLSNKGVGAVLIFFNVQEVDNDYEISNNINLWIITDD